MTVYHNETVPIGMYFINIESNSNNICVIFGLDFIINDIKLQNLNLYNSFRLKSFLIQMF